jgi:chemotaxis protein CheX
MLGIEEVVSLTHNVLFPLIGDVEEPCAPMEMPGGLLRGSVSIQGTSQAIVSVDCSEVLARSIAAAMFSQDPGELTEDEVLDSLGEIANIIGGNIKALLPGPSKLGLPQVERDVDGPPARPVVLQAFLCTGEPLRVTVATWPPPGAEDPVGG